MTVPELNALSDGWMQAFLAGDKKAFYQLVAAWKNPLFNYFYYQLGQLELAEELTQEVFIALFRTRQFKTQGLFSAWIYRVARNKLRDWLRRQKLDEILLVPTAHQFQHLPASSDPVQAALQGDEQQRILTVLAELSENDRHLLVLSQLQDLSYQEVANLMDCSLGSIKGKIFRAVRKFANKYRELYI